METSFSLSTKTPEETTALGRLVGECCEGGEVFLLRGTLGAGKTCFCQGLARGLGIPENEPVTSPTFTLHCQYFGRLEFNHLDAYRLEGTAGVEGLEELLGAVGAVAAVEWPDFISPQLPSSALSVDIEIANSESRTLVFSASDARAGKTLERIVRTCSQSPRFP